MLQLSEIKEIKDKRRGQGRMYDLEHVLLICILAVAAGANSYRAIARFIEYRFEWLQKHTFGQGYSEKNIHLLM
jgi:DDE_Tnp_1-associated